MCVVKFTIVIFTMKGKLIKIIKTKLFAKWAIKNQVSDESLRIAAKEIAIEIYEANYGGSVIKKRVANKGRGKSGSARTIVAFKKGKIAFLYLGLKKTLKVIFLQMKKKLLKLLLNPCQLIPI